MSHGPANTAWARSLVDELARAGVREVVLAPGSRSTPLVLAFAADERFRPRVHLDERSAAFFALGVGKAGGGPAAVVTTSGTAAANLLPAVVEASRSETPLLLLTADRPPRLRDADANQAIDQVGLYGRYVRDFWDLSVPVLGDRELRHLRSVTCRAVASALGPPAGPVHLNVPFEKPLEPEEPPESFAVEHPRAASGRSDGAPFVAIDRARPAADSEQAAHLVEALSSSEGVIVAGPTNEPERLGPLVRDVAARTGLPLLADPLSGARFGPTDDAQVIAAYDLLLREPVAVERLAPSVIVRVGATPTSAALQRWMMRHDGVAHVVVDDGGRWKDHGATATRYLRADPARTLRQVCERLRPVASDLWAGLWRDAERAALEAVADVAGDPHEGDVWPAVLQEAPSDGAIFVSNSMPVRDLDAFGHARREPVLVVGNRGASGIDGIVSTAFGVASRRAAPTVCVLGDIALFHDQNGLLWHREPDAAVVFVLVDNDGGGIFHALPVAAHDPHFTDYVATPHGLDLAHAMALHGIPLRDVDVSGLAPALRDAVRAGETAVLRVRSDRESNWRRHEEIFAAATRSVREALG